jgi:acylphosphatase
MAQQTIRFRIRPDGRVEELVEGVQGQACELLTERIEARLGAVQQRRPTAEAYQVAVDPQHQVLPATQASPFS